MPRHIEPEEITPGLRCLLRVHHSGVASSIERLCRENNIVYTKVDITEKLEAWRDRVIVKFLDPDLRSYACGDGGPGHNSCYKMNFYEDEPPAPFTTNKLGDFPKKEN